MYVNDTKDQAATMLALANLSQFNTRQKLQEAVVTFIVAQLTTKEDMIELQKAFRVLDTDNDGVLKKDELIAGYQKIYGPSAEEHVEKIFKRVDGDGSGEIDYTEWVIATINKESLLTEEKLSRAFALFDKDGGGSISADEVRNTLYGGDDQSLNAIDNAVWDKIIGEVDVDGSGEIEFDEFCEMMRKLLEDPNVTPSARTPAAKQEVNKPEAELFSDISKIIGA